MISDHAPLWGRLQGFDFDDPASPLPFTRRLARENRWTLDHARRVVEEYKRFALLAVVAGHPVTPSDAVDQAWHLHLVYTRSYWDEFSGEVLRTPLHHGPTRGGAAESAKYHDWYAKTLESYARIFGEPPPADLWPPAAVRFGRDLHFVRVNTESHWIVPRPDRLAVRTFEAAVRFVHRAAQSRRAASAAAVFLVALVLGGCVGQGGPADLSRLTGPQFLALFLPLALAASIGSLAIRTTLVNRAARGLSDPDLDGPPLKPAKLDPYEAALLLHGPGRAVLTKVALVKLAGRDAVEIDRRASPPWVSPGAMARDVRPDPIEATVLGAIRSRPVRLHRLLARVGRSAAADRAEANLLKAGLVIDRRDGRPARVASIIPLAPVLALGLWRIGLGVSRDRPVGFLAIICGFLAVCTIVHLVARPWRTRLGDEVAADLPRVAVAATDPADLETAALGFAIFGASGLPAGPQYEPIRASLARDPGAAGCGGGGGSGGCGGGGCGGCGGCGG